MYECFSKTRHEQLINIQNFHLYDKMDKWMEYKPHMQIHNSFDNMYSSNFSTSSPKIIHN